MCPEAANRPSDGVMEDQNFHLFQTLLLTMCDQSWTFTLLILGTLAFLAGVSSTAHAQNVFTVDATGDAPDTTPGDGTCATSGGNCTLRAAIQEANNTANATVADPDRIEFGISGTASPTSPHVIQPGSALPQITDQVVIDGTTEPDYDTESLGDSKPVVEIDGASAGDNVDGLNVGGGADGSRIEALSVINFNGSGASNGGAGIRGVDGLDVEGCYLGVRADGSTVAPNDRGIVLTGSDNTIVNSDLGGSNIIGGNDLQGIVVEGSDNFIRDNLIGTSPSGDDLLDLGNGAGASGSGEGIRLAGDDNELVFNAVAFNAGAGITVVNGATDNDLNNNAVFSNGDRGIDLGDDGRTMNDQGDGDDGNNRLQNYPEIQNARFTSTGDVEVTYLVPSDPDAGGSGASTYPLRIEFYKASADGEGGRFFLENDIYSAGNEGRDDDYGGCGAPPCPVTFTFTPSQSLVSRSDKLVATATDGDGNGNTSEFSPASSQLPVELASFEGTVVETSQGAEGTANAAVHLTWQTASETNNAGFEVQRQKESGWTQVGYVESRAQGGTTTETKSYSYTTEDLPIGTHQFRLKQVDLNGSSRLTDPVSVDIQMQEALRLRGPSPNPVSGRATVSFAVKERTETRITLYNTLGQQVATVYEGTPQAGEEQTARIDVSGLSSGTYFLRLRADGKTRTRRLAVVR
jgi:CSLREA domain-containing protein